MLTFLSYSHHDADFLSEFETHLALLKRDKLIDNWTDRNIVPGSKWRTEIFRTIEDADIIVFLVSPNFLASDFCQKEMTRAIELQDMTNVIILPIIIRHCSWKESRLAEFQALTEGGKPISAYSDHDLGWTEVVNKLRVLCQDWSFGNLGDDKSSGNSPFRIGVFGQVDTGKTSLCNALLDETAIPVSNSITQAREVNVATKNLLDSKILELHDCPGLGEDESIDEKHYRTYRRVLGLVDMVLWIIRADIRSLKEDSCFFKNWIKPKFFDNKHFLMIINKVDRMDPINDWDFENNQPGNIQRANLEIKKVYLSGAFNISNSDMLLISTISRYGVDDLMHRIRKLSGEKCYGAGMLQK